MAIGVLVIAAGASALRGGRYVHEEPGEAAAIATSAATSGAGTDIVADEIAADEVSAHGESLESVRAADGRATPDA